MSELLETYTFDFLYGKNKESKTKTWKISVEKYTSFSIIVTVYGYNRKIETRRIINSGKNLNKSNSTTHYQQAILEATSKWTKKKDIENYSTINPDLTDNNNNNNNKSMDNNETFNLEKLNINDTKTICFPMLAQDYIKHIKKITFPCFVQPKLDGYRMIYNTTTQSITTRQGKEFTIVKQSGNLYKELCSIPKGFILDGELYVHNSPQDDNKISFETLGVLRKTKTLSPKDKQNLEKIQYHVYDIIDTQLPFSKRINILNTLIQPSLIMIKNVLTIDVKSNDEINFYHNKFVNTDNYEGTIIRNYNGMYKEKFRSYDLLKYKDFNDAEFEIINYTFEKDTTGSNKNLIIWIIKITDNIECKVRPKGTREQRQQLYIDCQKNFSKFKGKKLWTKFFEYTADGNLRFPTTKTNDVLTYLRDEII
jgi:ATP-dependent DNA ligase